MAGREIVIKLNRVSKRYKLYNNKIERMKEAFHPFKKEFHKDFYALKDINIEINKGEILGIVGINGSGKSTLLKLIAGVLTPTSGDIMTKGKVIPLLELGSGFNPEFTGLENIYFYTSMLGIEKKKITEKIDEIIDFAEIGEYINQPLKTYSSGMKVRLAFAVSVNIDPDILILDEILSVGDELFRRKSFAKMEEFFKSEKTILFVSHSVNNIIQLCTRAILIDKGEILLQGTPKFVTSLYQKYIFSTKDKRDSIRNQLISLKEEEYTWVNEFEEDADTLTSTDQEYSVSQTIVEDEVVNKSKLSNSYFLPEFIPKSTVRISNFDIHIENIEIKNSQGKKVNVLILNEEYVYSYTTHFMIDVEKVTFGMQIKTEKGLPLEACNEPNLPRSMEFLYNIKKEDTFKIDWKFRCLLLPGNYYLNAGVYGAIEDFEGILCQIKDALVFKVENIENLKHSGFVKLVNDVKIAKL